MSATYRRNETSSFRCDSGLHLEMWLRVSLPSGLNTRRRVRYVDFRHGIALGGAHDSLDIYSIAARAHGRVNHVTRPVAQIDLAMHPAGQGLTRCMPLAEVWRLGFEIWRMNGHSLLQNCGNGILYRCPSTISDFGYPVFNTVDSRNSNIPRRV